MVDASQDPISNFKKAFVTGGPVTHLNNAGVTPMCRPVRETLTSWIERLSTEGAFAVDNLYGEMERVRVKLARFLNAPSRQVVFFQSAAQALSQIAFGLNLKPGDEIITWDQEYPSNFYPWRDAAVRAGGKLVVAKSGPDYSTPTEALLSQITPRTRVIAFSLAQFLTGAMTDIESIVAAARPKGILTVVDAIQALGRLPFDFEASGLDAVIGGSHKWMISPHGVGFFAARGELMEQLQPLTVGAMSYGTAPGMANVDAVPRTGPARFEPGSRAVIEIAALGTAVDLLMATGLDRIAQECEHFAKKLVHGLRERGYVVRAPHGSHHRGAIVSFVPSETSRYGEIPEIEAALNTARITAAVRGPGVRFSPHAFNTEEDIGRALGVLG